MPLPDNFNHWEHLQNVLMRVHNRYVRQEFKDLGESWDADITTPRGSLRVASTIVDNDSAIMCLIRMWLFYGVIRKMKDLSPDIYGIPVTNFQEHFRFLPQIQLYFLEDAQDVDQGYTAVAGEVSFRLRNETAQTLTMPGLMMLANRIKNIFATGNGYIWRKGRGQLTYTDMKKGYKLKVYCLNEAEGKQLIAKVLDVQTDIPNWEYSNYSQNLEPAEAFPIVPGVQTILGKPRKIPRRRPVARVRFQYALVHIHGLPNPICLVDRVNRYREALIKV